MIIDRKAKLKHLSASHRPVAKEEEYF